MEASKTETDETSIETGTQPQPQPQPPPLSTTHAIGLVITLTGAAFLNTFSTQAAVIILPTIGKDLHIPAARQQWVISAYALAFGCFLLLWGRLADVYSKRLVFIGGSAFVCVVTLVCPFVPSEIGFDIFRGLQGLGAAANVPTAIGILGVTFPPGKAKTYAFTAYSSGAPIGAVVGNIISGIVGQYASWKWVFWVLAIIAAMVTVAGHYVIPLSASHTSNVRIPNAVDWLGGAIITVALVLLLFALTEGNVVGWKTPWISALIVVSAVLIVVFVAWQLYLEKRTTRRPLMKLSIFKNRRVSAAMIIMTLFFGSFTNYLIFATYFYQDFQGLSKIATTIRFIPTGVCGFITISVVSQLLARVQARYIMMFGTINCALCSLLFAIPIPPGTTYWAFGFPAMCVSVFGADTIFPTILLFTSHSLPREDQAMSGAMLNAVGNVGRSISLAIATAIQVAVQEAKQGPSGAAVTGASDVGNRAFLAGIRAADWFSVGLALIALCIASLAFRHVGIIGGATK